MVSESIVLHPGIKSAKDEQTTKDWWEYPLCVITVRADIYFNWQPDWQYSTIS